MSIEAFPLGRDESEALELLLQRGSVISRHTVKDPPTHETCVAGWF